MSDDNVITSDIIKNAMVEAIGDNRHYITIIPEQGMVVSSVALSDMLHIFSSIIEAHKSGRYMGLNPDEAPPKDMH